MTDLHRDATCTFSARNVLGSRGRGRGKLRRGLRRRTSAAQANCGNSGRLLVAPNKIARALVAFPHFESSGKKWEVIDWNTHRLVALLARVLNLATRGKSKRESYDSARWSRSAEASPTRGDTSTASPPRSGPT